MIRKILIALVLCLLADLANAQSVNGCSRETATDLTGQAEVSITFANGNFTYAPSCVLVDIGTNITFIGSFAPHPLQGGVSEGGALTPATTGPFVPVTATGSSKLFTMTQNGTFPYYCDVHGTIGMFGAILVGPPPVVDPVFENGFE